MYAMSCLLFYLLGSWLPGNMFTYLTTVSVEFLVTQVYTSFTVHVMVFVNFISNHPHPNFMRISRYMSLIKAVTGNISFGLSV